MLAIPKYAYTYSGLTANDIYDLVNSRYFRGRLPKIPVRWAEARANKSKRRHILGATCFNHDKNGELRPTEIRLHPRLKTEGSIWVLTLIHEMVHVEQWKLPPEQSHGRKFVKRMKQLAQQGAFNGLW